MNDDRVLIKCENISKKFCRNFKQSLWYGLKNICSEYTGTLGHTELSLRSNEFWANRNISFEVSRGECLGLIGPNGSGKTTLLKCLIGVIKPDEGQIIMRGRIGALIALGAGFDNLLTGRENIFVNGAILGLSRQQVKRKLDEIVEFAELENSIDSSLQNYSSGMRVRLGFAVSAILARPDILLLDEILAVGDMSFVLKCLNHVRDIAKDSAVVLVSHSLTHIANFCSKAIVLDAGRVVYESQDVYKAIDHYVASNLDSRKLSQQISGAGTVELISVETTPETINRHESQPPGVVRLNAEINILEGASDCTVLVGVRSLANEPLMHMPLVCIEGKPLLFTEGRHVLRVDLPVGDLNAGVYIAHLTVVESHSSRVALRVDNAGAFRIVSDKVYWGKVVRNIRPEVDSF